MKTVFSVICMIGLTVMLTSCKGSGDDDGTAGGRGDFPDVSYERYDEGEQHRMICYNADSNVYTSADNQTICTWNCAYYQGATQPRWVRLVFRDVAECEATTGADEDTGTDEDTGVSTEQCTTDLALVYTQLGGCTL